MDKRENGGKINKIACFIKISNFIKNTNYNDYLQISKEGTLNPIKQDIKKGKLRFVANCFPHHGYIWNYGAFPQTWENPDHIEPSTSCKGM